MNIYSEEQSDNSDQFDNFTDLYNQQINLIYKREIKKNNYVSLFFIAICVFVFFYLLDNIPDLSNESEALEFMHNFGLSIHSLDNPSSFLMAHFTHLSIFHMLPNCLFFFLIARIISFGFDWKNLFFLCGIAIITTSFFSYIHLLYFIPDNENMIVIGFSGVAFAVIGVFFHLMETALKIKNILLIGGFHLLFIFIDGINIAWFAHLYGFLTGFVFILLLGDRVAEKHHCEAFKKAQENY